MGGISLTLNLLGGLAVFLYGMKVMSEGLQKVSGDKLRSLFSFATNNRISATFVGFVVTCFVQSSSATTVMVVSFVSAGLLTLTQSIGIIFGANIGTTTTGWIISLLGFKVKIATFALPLIGIGFFSQFIRRWRWPHRVGEILFGFGILFFGLSIIKQIIPNVTQSEYVSMIISSFDASHLGPRLGIVLVGTVLTMIFQSSSAMMAVTLAAAASGLINFSSAAALVLGENIGTTLTANIAAIGAPLTARRSARAHFMFNIMGVLWAIFLFSSLLKFVDWIVPGDPTGSTEQALLVYIPTHIAAFHTIFNVINTLLGWTILKQLERFVIWLVPDTSASAEPDLVYLTTPLSQTSELDVSAAKMEVDRMGGIIISMLDKIIGLLNDSSKNPSKDIAEVLKEEKLTDQLEHKINVYLSNLTHGHLSSSSNKQVLSMFSMINDLERLGDHGEKIVGLLDRTKEKGLSFSAEGAKGLEQMADKTREIVTAMKGTILNVEQDSLEKAREREKDLNEMRYKIREGHIDRIRSGKCEPYAGIIFTDMLTSFEKMGDHAYNVVEASVGIK